MNNDIKWEVSKYLSDDNPHEEFSSILHTKEYISRKIKYTSLELNEKLKNRPTIHELKNKNIIRNELVNKEIKKEVIDNLIEKSRNPKNEFYIAPSISGTIKKMNFEFKKIIIKYKIERISHKNVSVRDK